MDSQNHWVIEENGLRQFSGFMLGKHGVITATWNLKMDPCGFQVPIFQGVNPLTTLPLQNRITVAFGGSIPSATKRSGCSKGISTTCTFARGSARRRVGSSLDAGRSFHRLKQFLVARSWSDDFKTPTLDHGIPGVLSI